MSQDTPQGFLPPDYPDLRGAACEGAYDLVDNAYAQPGGHAGEELKRLCRGCPVVHECHAWGTDHEQHGIWGGVGPNMRTRTRRLRGGVAAAA